MNDDGSHEDERFPEQLRSMFRHQEGEVIILSSAALILRQMLDNIWAVVRMTFLDSLFCVATPTRLSTISFTSS